MVPDAIIVFRFSSLGDVAMSVPVLLSFRKAYPNVKIYMVSHVHYEPLFSQIPNLTFIPVNFKKEHKGLFGWIKLMKTLKKLPTKHIADIHNVLRSVSLDYFFKLIGYQVVIIEKGREDKKALIHRKSKTPLISTHERYKNTFSKLGFTFDLNPSNLFPSKHSSSDIKKIGVAPFAKHIGKEYSIDNIYKVLIKFSNKNRYKIYFFGHGDIEKNRIDNTFNAFENYENTIGQYSFEEELSLISSLDLMVSMDSGNGHLAAMYGVPVVTIWGVTHYHLGYFPYNMPMKNSIFPNKLKYPELPVSIYGKCNDDSLNQAINDISPEEIIFKIEEMLSHAN